MLWLFQAKRRRRPVHDGAENLLCFLQLPRINYATNLHSDCETLAEQFRSLFYINTARVRKLAQQVCMELSERSGPRKKCQTLRLAVGKSGRVLKLQPFFVHCEPLYSQSPKQLYTGSARFTIFCWCLDLAAKILHIESKDPEPT